MVEKEEIKGLKMDRRASRFKRICVFCGSSSGKKTLYRNVALDLGKEMVKRKIDLVYGGGSVGLMGQIAQTVHDGGGHVIGVIPKALMPQEISGQTVGELRAVSDMHERKAEMARQADAFIALPVTHQRKNTLVVMRALSNGKFFAPQSDGYFALSGGYGTLEELLEMITWVQLGIHDKPVGLLNVDGYYNSLLALFDKAVEEGFLKPSARNILLSAPTARELLEKFEEYEPTHERIVARGSWEVDMRGDMRGLENMGYNAAVNC